jgi:hypothetical protein
VPAVLVSPYSKPTGVTNLVHDHTSVLATIEHKWNLPALTYRDANAATVMDFLDADRAALMSPPTVQQSERELRRGTVERRDVCRRSDRAALSRISLGC